MLVTNLLVFSIIALDVFTGEAALVCDDCPGCGGTCQKTPTGQVCACDDDKFGTNCDLCLIRAGWTDGENGYQYMRSSSTYDYVSAQLYCEKFKGHLAIHGPRDPVWLGKDLTSLDNFVGLTDRDTEGTFYWNDGVLADEIHTPWLAGQPDNSNGGQDCVVLSSDNTLRDVSCDGPFYALCEVPIDYPARIPKFSPKNGCEYSIIPPAFHHVSKLLCEEIGGKLAAEAINNGNVLKKILHHYTGSGHITDGVFTGFELEVATYVADGVVLDVSGPQVEWAPDSPGNSLEDCIIAKITPDWYDYGWIEDDSCYQRKPGLCETCSTTTISDEKTCKSGKICSGDNVVCVIHEGTCFEECICAAGYTMDPNNGICINDGLCAGYDCGSNAFCVFDVDLNRPTCKCEDDYLPAGTNDDDGCSQPSCAMSCGSGAICVRNLVTYTDECICVDNHIPDPNTVNACVQDPCAPGGTITCGANARCCITDVSATTAECLCDEGYYYRSGSVTECFDPCDAGEISCGTGAICVVDKNASPVVATCKCRGDDISLGQPIADGCITDGCLGGGTCDSTISKCCMTDKTVGTQECLCNEGRFGTLCEDPCAVSSCTGDKSCMILDETKAGSCECNEGFLRNAAGNCVADECASITCVEAICGVLDPPSTTKGCVCNRGYTYDGSSTTNCIECPQTKWVFPDKDVNDYLVVDDPDDLPALGEITVCAWVTPPSGEFLSGTLLSYSTPSKADTFVIYFPSGNLGTHVVRLSSSVSGVEDATFSLSVSEKTHLCYIVARSSSYAQLYVDGKLSDTVQYDSNEGDPAVDNGRIIIGQKQTDTTGTGATFVSAESFRGTIENLLVYDEKLTRDKIKLMASDQCACVSGYIISLEDDKVTDNGDVENATPEACT